MSIEQLNKQSHVPLNDRVFNGSNGWFFATREGVSMGPFPNRRSAESEISNYLRSMSKLSKAV